MIERNLNQRVYTRTNKNDGWFRSKKGYGIRFNWMRNAFDWLMGVNGYDLNDWGSNIKFTQGIWDYVRLYPARVIARVRGKFSVDLANDEFEDLFMFFLDSGLIQVEGDLKDLPRYQWNNIIMFVDLVKEYFYLNQDKG